MLSIGRHPRSYRVAMLATALAAVIAGGLVLPADSRSQTLPPGYDHFTSAVTLWLDGTDVVLQADAVPNHNSPYFPMADPRYEAYNGSNPNWQQNPNTITPQTLEFHIPANPQPASTHPPTPLGPIGVAVNGVPLFNQYAGPGQPLTTEINSFDQYDGHPQETGIYHYHVEPYALTFVNGKDSLIGYLLDGYPVYGPEENGVTITNADLDQYHGHFHATADYPQGVYHYHITAESPYIAGTGFYGSPGTLSMTFSATPTPTTSATATATATATTSSPAVGGIAAPPPLAPAPAGTRAAGGRSVYLWDLALVFAATLAVGALVWRRRSAGRR